MAGLGLGPADFELFEIDDPGQRAAALETTLRPKLQAIGEQCLGGLSRLSGRPLHLHAARTTPRRGQPPGELLMAFSGTPRAWRGLPFLGVAVTRAHLHARIGVRGESSGRAAMLEALRREAANLARKGKPFRKLRQFTGWDYEELPELAAAHSAAFWTEPTKTSLTRATRTVTPASTARARPMGQGASPPSSDPAEANTSRCVLRENRRPSP